MIQEFEIPLKFVSLNEYIALCKKAHGLKAQEYKRTVQDFIIWNIKAAKLKRINKPVFVSFTWYEDTKRRDKDNVRFAKKFINDRLQEAHILPNDNNEYVVGFTDRFIYGQGQKVKVTLEEADE